MTINDFIAMLEGTPIVPVGVVALPLIAFGVGRLHKRKLQEKAPVCAVYSALVYVSCCTGIFAATVLAYEVIFQKANVLDLNVVTYFGPILSMIATIAIVNKQVDLAYVPGFDRLVGLLVLMTTAIVLALIVAKTRIWLVFGSSFATFVTMVIGLFVLLRIGAGMMFGSKSKNASPQIDLDDSPTA